MDITLYGSASYTKPLFFTNLILNDKDTPSCLYNSINQSLPPTHTGCLLLTSVNNVAVSMLGEESAEPQRSAFCQVALPGEYLFLTLSPERHRCLLPFALTVVPSCLSPCQSDWRNGMHFIVCTTPVWWVCTCFTGSECSLAGMTYYSSKHKCSNWAFIPCWKEVPYTSRRLLLAFHAENSPLLCLISFIVDGQKILAKNCKNCVKRSKNFPQPENHGWVTKLTVNVAC